VHLLHCCFWTCIGPNFQLNSLNLKSETDGYLSKPTLKLSSFITVGFVPPCAYEITVFYFGGENNLMMIYIYCYYVSVVYNVRLHVGSICCMACCFVRFVVFNFSQLWEILGTFGIGLNRLSYSTSGPVSTGMGDLLWVSKPSLYVISHLGPQCWLFKHAFLLKHLQKLLTEFYSRNFGWYPAECYRNGYQHCPPVGQMSWFWLFLI